MRNSIYSSTVYICIYVTGISHFDSFLRQNARKKRGNARRGGGDDARERMRTESLLSPSETEMESCARDDYARERNKERNKDEESVKGRGKDGKSIYIYTLGIEREGGRRAGTGTVKEGCERHSVVRPGPLLVILPCWTK